MPHSTGPTLWLLVALIILVWPLFFIALWSAIVYGMSRLGGWHRLARTHGSAALAPEGRIYQAITGMIGISSYKRVLTIICSDKGMLVTVRWVFRMGHPPLFIAWSDVRNARRMTLFYRDYVAFDIGDPRIASMRLPLQVFDDMPVFIETGR